MYFFLLFRISSHKYTYPAKLHSMSQCMHKKQSCSHKIIFLFQICIPIKEDPYYKCICKAGYESDKRTGKTGKCVIANRSQFLLYGQQKPGVVRGLDIKSPDQVSRVRFDGSFSCFQRQIFF